MRYELTNTSEQLIMAQAERDHKALRIEQLIRQHGPEEDESQTGSSQEPELAVITGHLNKIAALEKEVKHLKQVIYIAFFSVIAMFSVEELGNECVAVR